MNWIDYIPHGILGTATAVVAWVGKQHISYDKKTRERVEALEVNTAGMPTKDDLDRIHSRIDGLSTEISAGQRDILAAIAGRQPRL